ncbi:MAG TPA: hypothetical protein VHH11_13765 [Gammaproteobacteria bacterium]|nr:hypothetical protein [Gammaproteobacteria bacterium]
MADDNQKQIILDAQQASCLPFDPARIPVLGDPDSYSIYQPGVVGSEKALTGFRRQVFAVQFTQAAAAVDPILVKPTTTSGPAQSIVNVWSYGSPVSQGDPTNPATAANFPVTYNGGVIGYQDSNFYIGGLMCQPNAMFVSIAISVRVMQAFRVTGPSGYKRREQWMDSYQAAIQQQILDNTVWTYKRNRETTTVLGENLSKYTSAYSSGQPLASSQNGEPLKGNIYPLCEGITSAAEAATSQGATPYATLNMITNQFAVSPSAFAPVSSRLTDADPLVVPVEVIFFGYCAPWCPTDIQQCLTPRGAPVVRQPANNPGRPPMTYVPG